MLKKLGFLPKHHLRTPREIRAVFSVRKRLFSNNFQLFYAINSYDHGRTTVIIGRKTMKKAVARNRVRRQVRETFRQRPDDVCGWDILVLPKKGSDQVLHSELREELSSLFAKLKRKRLATL